MSAKISKRDGLWVDSRLPEKIVAKLEKMTSSGHQVVAAKAKVGFWTVQGLAYRKQKSASFETLFRLGLVLFPRKRKKDEIGQIDDHEDSNRLLSLQEQQIRASQAALTLIAEGVDLKECQTIARQALIRLESLDKGGRL